MSVPLRSDDRIPELDADCMLAELRAILGRLLCSNPEIAYEVIQEAFVTILRALRRGQPVEVIYGHLPLIAWSRYRDVYRKRRREERTGAPMSDRLPEASWDGGLHEVEARDALSPSPNPCGRCPPPSGWRASRTGSRPGMSDATATTSARCSAEPPRSSGRDGCEKRSRPRTPAAVLFMNGNPESHRVPPPESPMTAHVTRPILLSAIRFPDPPPNSIDEAVVVPLVSAYKRNDPVPAPVVFEIPGGLFELLSGQHRVTNPVTALTRCSCRLRPCRFTWVRAWNTRTRRIVCSTRIRRRDTARLYRRSAAGRGFPRGLRRGVAQATPGRTFAAPRYAVSPIRPTPFGRHPSNRDRFRSVRSAVGPGGTRRPGRYFDLLDHNVHGEDVVAFLAELHRRLGRVTVVWDRNQIHSKSKVVRAWLAGHPDVVAEDFPGYVPDLNPDEGVWRWTRYGRLANLAAADKDELWDRVVDELIEVKFRPNLLRGFIQQTRLPGLALVA